MGMYYFRLATLSLLRDVSITALMVAAIGIGLGAFLVTTTIYRAMTSDPIPGKSQRLFVPQIDNWGPGGSMLGHRALRGGLPDGLTYRDASQLLAARPAPRRTATYPTSAVLTISGASAKPLSVTARAASTDFFGMFEVPFRFGAPWNASDDEGRGAVAVISAQLNDRLFSGRNSVGMTIDLDGTPHRVVGVLDEWQPVPKFFDLSIAMYGRPEDLFLPFNRAIESRMDTVGSINCARESDASWEARLLSECVWLQYWVELPDVTAQGTFRTFLDGYAREQRTSGRFAWDARTELRSLREWLDLNGVVSDAVRILVPISMAFFFVCLLNAMSLMLAKLSTRTHDISVRRAVGASRVDIARQYLAEAAMVGVAGGMLGLLVTALGVLGLRSLLSEEIEVLTRLDGVTVIGALLVAILAAIVTGLYPTLRAARVQPAAQLRAG